MSLYHFLATETYVALCDGCHFVAKTPTASGRRLPTGWRTDWLDYRIDRCAACAVRNEPGGRAYDGSDEVANEAIKQAAS